MLLAVAVKFAAEEVFPTGFFDFGMTVADFNGDGKPDVASVGQGGNHVEVLLGNGNGTFQPEVSFATGIYPRAIAAADLTGDGNTDLVTANYNSNSISVLLGNGNGTFQPQKTFAAPGAYSVAVADFNGDNKPDIAVVTARGNVGILLGNGNGTFQGDQTIATGVAATSVVAADINGDGRPDLFVDGSGLISVLLSNGNGTFQAPRTLYAGPDPYTPAVGDINGDGKPDLIVSNGIKSGATVSVLLGNGNGTFLPRVTFAVGKYPSGVTVGDFNGDGAPDLAVLNLSSGSYSIGTVSVLLGNGNGTFLPAQTFAAGNVPRGEIFTADVNGDGVPDLLANDPADSQLVVLTNITHPTVLSINRANPLSASTGNSSVSYTVTFSQPVTGVTPSSFTVATSGTTF